MQVVHRRRCRLDVHRKTMVACGLLTKDGGRTRKQVLAFGTMTEDLPVLSDWLAALEVAQIAMVSTGVQSRRVRFLPEGGQVRKDTRGPTTHLAAKAKGDNSMLSMRGGTEGV